MVMNLREGGCAEPGFTGIWEQDSGRLCEAGGAPEACNIGLTQEPPLHALLRGYDESDAHGLTLIGLTEMLFSQTLSIMFEISRGYQINHHRVVEAKPIKQHA